MFVLKCPHCGAPLPPALHGVIACPFCDHLIADVPAVPWGRTLPPWEGRPEDAGRTRVTVGDQRYVVLGRLARGDSSDVFFARRDTRLAELAVLKVLRAPEDADLLAREQTVLRRLATSRVSGDAYFRRLLPQPIRHGVARIDGVEGPLASAFRWRSGFTTTLDDVCAAYPTGVDPRAAVWMWKRTLELLGFVHRSGVVHGAVLPAHLLVHPRDHAVVLVGWSAAVWRHGRGRASLPAFRASARELYPKEVWDGAPPSPALDLTMAARAIAYVVGGQPSSGRVPKAVPRPLAALLARYADPAAKGRLEDAWELEAAVAAAAEEAYGAPAYVKFEMPARSRHRR